MAHDAALKAAGAELRRIRESKGLSQEALAINANVDQSALSKMERLGPYVVSWNTFLRVLDHLGVSIEIKFPGAP